MATHQEQRTNPTTAPADGVSLSKTIRKLADHDGASIVFSFDGPYYAGDCKLGGGALSVFPDGHAEWFSGDVMSTTGDDSWLATFEFFDDHGVSLWRFGRIASPSLSPPYAVITWDSRDQLFFPAYIFPSIARVSMTYHC
ncbi:DUF6294 family protein [Streptomyces sp. NPDC101152]|uniref:DUF6294 family protein n=1 Tax=Streptomyces sp. NPDC101152 TaxID=3366116 RepID=UPI0037FB57EF